VHGRTAAERGGIAVRWEAVSSIVTELSPVPIIINGDIWDPKEVTAARHVSGCQGIMVGRAALRNMHTIFKSVTSASPMDEISGASQDVSVDPVMDLVREYCEIAIDVNNPTLNTRFVMEWMLHEVGRLRSEETGKRLKDATSLRDVSAAVGLEDYYDSKERGDPSPPTHYYADSDNYFNNIGASYFIRRPETSGAELVPVSVVKKSNSDFKKMLELKRKAREEGLAAPKKKKKKKKELLNHKYLLCELLKSRCLPPPKWGKITTHPASERVMGYFAEAFSSEVEVSGVLYRSDKFASSRERAAQRAAAAAMSALSISHAQA